MIKVPRKNVVKPLLVSIDPVILDKATGFKNSKAQHQMLSRFAESFTMPTILDEAQCCEFINAAIAVLADLKPEDGFEGMLASQMVAGHYAAMDCLKRAALADQTFEGRHENLKRAEKLMSLYIRQVQAMDKHRGKGQQKVTVEHVHVGEGGQAIVGNVTTGVSSTSRKGDKPPAAIPNDPGEGMAIPLVKKPKARKTIRKK